MKLLDATKSTFAGPLQPQQQQCEDDEGLEESEPLLQQQPQENNCRVGVSVIRKVINSENRLVYTLLGLSLCLVTISTQFQAVTGASVGVVYDSRCPIQYKLYKAVWMGFRDSIKSDAPQTAPLLLDVGTVRSVSQIASWVHGNGTKSLVSLLDERKLRHVLDSYSTIVTTSDEQEIRIILPRSCLNLEKYVSARVKVQCLRMGDEAIATALLHRILKVGTTTLMPILDDSGRSREKQLSLLRVYTRLIESMGHKLELTPTIFGMSSVKKKLSRYSNSYKGNGNKTGNIGLLVLARGSKILASLAATSPSVHTFSPYGVEELLSSNGTEIDRALTQHPVGVYTQDYVGSIEWDNPARRRALVELNSFIGSNPLILAAVLAYDATAIAVTPTLHRLPLTGPYDVAEDGTRVNGVLFGITPKPTVSQKSLAVLLQPSDFILQDMITVVPNTGSDSHKYTVVNYQIATSSVLSQEELLTLALMAESKYGCSEHGLEVTTHDPFNQLAYTFHFLPHTLPAYLLIPNQYGYGLELSCQTGNGDTEATTSILIACTPTGQSLDEPVHCFRSNPHRRARRHAPVYKGAAGGQQQQYYHTYQDSNSNIASTPQYYPRSYFYPYTKNFQPIARDDNANNLYYQPPAGVYGTPSSPAPPPAYGYYGYPEVSSPQPPVPSPGYGYNGYQDSSTAGYLTTRLDVPINEEPPPSSPPPPPASKLPELRQVLKAAKPFVGSCVGSTTGCAVCVLVLGRLPLGAVPAACTGPCFVGTFGSCGSLLGRVFSETTIICTELFKQGHLDIVTFIADAEFGRLIAQQSPETLQGYQFLATPLVHTMKTSAWVTGVVAKIATSWAQHMRYLMGHSGSRDWLGEWIHWTGTPLCTITGHLLNLGLQDVLCLAIFLIAAITAVTSIANWRKKRNCTTFS